MGKGERLGDEQSPQLPIFVDLTVPALEVSLVDHTPEELMTLTLSGLQVASAQLCPTKRVLAAVPFAVATRHLLSLSRQKKASEYQPFPDSAACCRSSTKRG